MWAAAPAADPGTGGSRSRARQLAPQYALAHGDRVVLSGGYWDGSLRCGRHHPLGGWTGAHYWDQGPCFWLVFLPTLAQPPWLSALQGAQPGGRPPAAEPVLS